MKYYLIKTDNEPIDNCFEDKVLNWTTNSIMEPIELTEEELNETTLNIQENIINKGKSSRFEREFCEKIRKVLENENKKELKQK